MSLRLMMKKIFTLNDGLSAGTSTNTVSGTVLVAMGTGSGSGCVRPWLRPMVNFMPKSALKCQSRLSFLPRLELKWSGSIVAFTSAPMAMLSVTA